MRPKSIILFERLYLLAIAIEVVRIAIQWPQIVQSSSADLSGRILAVGLSLLFLLLASRRNRWWAALILAGLFVIGLPMASYVFSPGYDPLTAAIIAIQIALQAAALMLILKPDSRAWFKSPPTA